jgi:hypothetical protein
MPVISHAQALSSVMEEGLFWMFKAAPTNNRILQTKKSSQEYSGLKAFQQQRMILWLLLAQLCPTMENHKVWMPPMQPLPLVRTMAACCRVCLAHKTQPFKTNTNTETSGIWML